MEVFLDITPKELYTALKEKEEYDGYTTKSIIRPICETIRMEAYWLVNIQLDKKKKLKHPSKLMAFEWDQKIKEEQSKEQMLAVMRNIVMDTKGRKSKTENT